MKIKVNTKVIEKLDPCKDRLDNWKRYYSKFNGDIIEFLDLPNITEGDKVWVACRVIPKFLVEVFAIDCAAAAAAAASYAANAANAANAADAANAAYYASYAADAAYAAGHAADAAYYAIYAAADAASYAAYYAANANAKDGERQRQIESIICLITTTTLKETRF